MLQYSLKMLQVTVYQTLDIKGFHEEVDLVYGKGIIIQAFSRSDKYDSASFAVEQEQCCY